MKKRKIALVYDSIYPYIMGGAERRFYELGKRLVDDKTEVHLYGMKLWDGPKVIERDGLILHGISKARPLYTKTGRRSIKQALLFGLSTFKLTLADFDVIDCCGFPYFSLFPAKLAATIKGKPLYATWHEVWGKKYWQEYLGMLGFLGYWIERLAAQQPNEIIVVFGQVEHELRTILGVQQPIHVVHNGIDHEHIRSLPASSLNADLLYVGRLVEFKHVDDIVRVVAYLKTKGQRVTCNIIGDGPQLSSLKDLAAKLNVSRQIRWLGFIDKSKDVYGIMKASGVLLLPSSREGFGMVVIEAHACNLPVVTVDEPTNSARLLVRDGVNGSVVTLNVQALADASSYWLKKTSEEHQLHVRQFDWFSLVTKLSKVYV